MGSNLRLFQVELGMRGRGSARTGSNHSDGGSFSTAKAGDMDRDAEQVHRVHQDQRRVKGPTTRCNVELDSAVTCGVEHHHLGAGPPHDFVVESAPYPDHALLEQLGLNEVGRRPVAMACVTNIVVRRSTSHGSPKSLGSVVARRE
jgi:hypothetical protein